ncbi:MAG: methyltransferase type 11, partial [Actinomycetota bacterium]|nr:methyltransferase type 11 [Actinomycetota bacterium]
MTVTFDPVRYKDTTRAQWEEAAAAWHRWGPTLETWLGA